MNSNLAQRASNDIFLSVGGRSLVVILALLIIFLRIPYYFLHPLILGEDGVLWLQDYMYGVRSLAFPFVGYLAVSSRVVTLAARAFPIEYFPVVIFWIGIAIDLIVIWMLTSPRLDLPYRPLIALTVVSTAVGSHILGVSMTHIQWIMPLGVFALIFMRPSGRLSILTAEAVFALASALTGPFSVTLAPLVAVQAFLVRKDANAARRMLVLTAAVGIGMLSQLAMIFSDPSRSFQPNLRPPFHWWATSDWAALINLSFQHLFMPIGEWIFTGRLGVVIAVVIGSVASTLVAVSLVKTDRYRTQKIFMIVFAGSIAVAGIVKVGAQERYFYIASVMMFWVLYCVVAEMRVAISRYVSIAILLAVQVGMVAYYQGTYLNIDKETWPRWSKFVHSGLPLTVPIVPDFWFINIPADASGPMSDLNHWVGTKLAEAATEAGNCGGEISSVKPLNEDYYVYKRPNINAYTGTVPRWTARGEINRKDIDIVIVTDTAERVLGFGVAGFDANATAGSKWIATFPATKPDIRVYGLFSDKRRVCLISVTVETPK